MSGGKRIDDHKAWMGSGSKGVPLPMGSKMKSESSAEGAGHEMYYEDTTEAIKAAQEKGDAKAKSHKMKDGYRY